MILFSIYIIILFSPHMTMGDSCQSFPFSKKERWDRFLQDCSITHSDHLPSQGISDESYTSFRFNLPHTLETYLQADHCLDHEIKGSSGDSNIRRVAREFQIRISLSRGESRGTISCHYGTVSELSSRTEDQCNGSFIHFQAHPCEVDLDPRIENTLNVMGYSSGGEYTNLGKINLPLLLWQVHAKNQTSATLKLNKKCPEPRGNPRSYAFRCGKLKFPHVNKYDELTINNLFPGKRYECSYEYDNCKPTNETKSITFETDPLKYSFDEITPFAIDHDGVHLVRHLVDDLLSLDSNINITVNVTNQETGQAITVSADKATVTGITGLVPVAHYLVCLNVKQLESYYKPEDRVWCYNMVTLPPHGSRTGLWVALITMGVIILMLLLIQLRGNKFVKEKWDRFKMLCQERRTNMQESVQYMNK